MQKLVAFKQAQYLEDRNQESHRHRDERASSFFICIHYRSNVLDD